MHAIYSGDIEYDYIAAPAYLAARDGYRTKGGTGVGIRLIFDYFKNLGK